MAHPIEATPMLKGEEAIKLVKSVMNARPDPQKRLETEKRVAFIKSLKRRGTLSHDR